MWKTGINNNRIMTTLPLIIIIASAIGITFFLIVRKKGEKGKKVMKKNIDLSEPAKWVYQEIQLVYEINEWRKEKGFSWLKEDDNMKVLSQGRVKFWMKHKTAKENLHNWFLIHIKVYLQGKYSKIGEAAQAGYTKIVRAYKKSPKHTASILKPDWKYIAITVRKNRLGRNRTCLILAK